MLSVVLFQHFPTAEGRVRFKEDSRDLPGSTDLVCSEYKLVLPLIVNRVLNKSGTSLTRDWEGRQNMDNYSVPADCINDRNVCNKTVISALAQEGAEVLGRRWSGSVFSLDCARWREGDVKLSGLRWQILSEVQAGVGFPPLITTRVSSWYWYLGTFQYKHHKQPHQERGRHVMLLRRRAEVWILWQIGLQYNYHSAGDSSGPLNPS